MIFSFFLVFLILAGVWKSTSQYKIIRKLDSTVSELEWSETDATVFLIWISGRVCCVFEFSYLDLQLGVVLLKKTKLNKAKVHNK